MLNNLIHCLRNKYSVSEFDLSIVNSKYLPINCKHDKIQQSIIRSFTLMVSKHNDE